MNESNKPLNRRDFLKLAGGAVGLGGLSFLVGKNASSEPETAGQTAEYVDGLSPLPVLRAPYTQKQARMAAFLFAADMVALTVLCDRYLSTPTCGAYKYVPLMGNLIMTYTEMKNSSLDERDASVGCFGETEVAFWIPTLVMRKVADMYVPERLAWFLPYLFVDDAIAIAAGREVYGFNKQWGQFQKPVDLQNPEFTTSVMGIRQFDPASQAQLEPLLRVKQLNNAVSQPEVSWLDWQSARDDLSSELVKNSSGSVENLVMEYAARLMTDPAALVFLKQFRSAVDTRQACYQAIIEAPIHITQFKAGGFLRQAYQLEINPLESHPLAKSLGLPAEAQTASASAWLELDFSLGAGMEVYRAV